MKELKKLADEIVAELVDCGAADPEPVEQYQKWTLNRLEKAFRAFEKSAETKLAASTAVKEVWKDRAWTAEEKLAELVPEGWKLVPVEPTEEMVINGFESQPDECLSDPAVWEKYSQMSGCQQASYEAQLCWLAMLAAAPCCGTK